MTRPRKVIQRVPRNGDSREDCFKQCLLRYVGGEETWGRGHVGRPLCACLCHHEERLKTVVSSVQVADVGRVGACDRVSTGGAVDAVARKHGGGGGDGGGGGRQEELVVV
jgi:hypothetical protein